MSWIEKKNELNPYIITSQQGFSSHCSLERISEITGGWVTCGTWTPATCLSSTHFDVISCDDMWCVVSPKRNSQSSFTNILRDLFHEFRTTLVSNHGTYIPNGGPLFRPTPHPRHSHQASLGVVSLGPCSTQQIGSKFKCSVSMNFKYRCCSSTR